MKQLCFIILPALLLSLTALASAQAPAHTPPRINMGLWHEEVTTTIAGIDGVMPTAQKDTEQFCINADSWRKYGLQAANSRCSVSNLHQEARKLSYDVSCGSQNRSSMIFHMNILIDSDRQMHGTAMATITTHGSLQRGTWTSTVTERYLAPDCGGLKPGEKRPDNK